MESFFIRTDYNDARAKALQQHQSCIWDKIGQSPDWRSQCIELSSRKGQQILEQSFSALTNTTFAIMAMTLVNPSLWIDIQTLRTLTGYSGTNTVTQMVHDMNSYLVKAESSYHASIVVNSDQLWQCSQNHPYLLPLSLFGGKLTVISIESPLHAIDLDDTFEVPVSPTNYRTVMEAVVPTNLAKNSFRFALTGLPRFVVYYLTHHPMTNRERLRQVLYSYLNRDISDEYINTLLYQLRSNLSDNGLPLRVTECGRNGLSMLSIEDVGEVE